MNSQIRELFSVGSQGLLSQDRNLITGRSIGASLLWSLMHNKAWMKLADNYITARQASFI
jgi:hypothetical protein